MKWKYGIRNILYSVHDTRNRGQNLLYFVSLSVCTCSSYANEAQRYLKAPVYFLACFSLSLVCVCEDRLHTYAFVLLLPNLWIIKDPRFFHPSLQYVTYFGILILIWHLVLKKNMPFQFIWVHFWNENLFHTKPLYVYKVLSSKALQLKIIIALFLCHLTFRRNNFYFYLKFLHIWT